MFSHRAGYGAARALVQAGVPVTVLDASEQPGGLAATSQKGGRKVEPGIKVSLDWWDSLTV